MASKIPVEDRIPISNIIAQTRFLAGMTQKKFGEHLGVTAKQVRRYEAAEAIPKESKLRKVFHIGLKVAAPFIHQLPGYVPAMLTLEAINEITEAVRKEKEQEEHDKARIDEITTQIAEQTEAACKARESSDNQGVRED